MKPSTEVLLKENLKLLKLSNVLRQLETFIRQAKENGTDYGYGDIFERNLGMGSPLKIERGLNANHCSGGLLLSPFFE